MICINNSGIDRAVEKQLNILTALVFNLNQISNYEKALHYNQELHALNKAVSLLHPNTINSCITTIKLINKQTRTDYSALKIAAKKELFQIIMANCELFVDEPACDLSSDEDGIFQPDGFVLFQKYILQKSTIDFLHQEFDYLLQ